MQQLARRQERELRNWLYGDELHEATLKVALTAAAAESKMSEAYPLSW